MLIKIINTYVLNHINSTAKQYKASSSLRACFCCPAGRRFPFSQEKHQSCLKVTLKSIRRISRAWSSRFDSPLASTIKKRREILKREEKSPSFPFEGNEGLPSLHGEMCATARTHLLGEKRATARPLLLQWSGMCEGATYGKVVPSRLFHLRSVS